MKKFEKHRLGVQALCLALTIAGFFTNFKGILLVIFGLTFIFGVFYCGWMCPFGFIQDLFSKLGKLLGIKKRKTPKPLQRIFVFARYIIFILIFLVQIDLVFGILKFDPRVNFERLLLGKSVETSIIVLICLFSLISLFFERPFCNYLCYQGAKYGLASIFRPFTIKRNELSCINCKKCEKACPMNIEVSKCSNLRSPQCINCFQCISSCPVENTLEYGKMNMNKNEKKKYLSMLAFASVLIIGFSIYNVLNSTNVPSKSVENNISIENSGDTAGLADGIYTGKGEGFKGTITVKVTVKDQKITAIQVTQHNDDMKWFNRANNIIPNTIIDTQSTDVDLVSGATYSSTGIRDAVKNALENAK